MASMQQEHKPKIVLHWLEKSRSQRIAWLLEELNVEYELKTYKRGSDRLAPPDLKQYHPLGTSPLITVEVPGSKPMVMVESAQMTEYLTDYYGKSLVPDRYPVGKEGQIGTETEEWVRYRHYMHYAEGSLMPLMILGLFVGGIKSSPVPFFIKPITRGVASRIEDMFLNKKFQDHFSFVEEQLKTAPNGGGYLCGNKLTAADILMSFPLGIAGPRAGLTKEKYPAIFAYNEKLSQGESYKRTVKKVEEATGEKYVIAG